MLGCTARRAMLGIHRTQAGRSGSRLGRDQRAEARCSTTTPSIDSVTSATGPGRPAAGRCRPSRSARCRPGRGPTRSHRHRTQPPLRARARCPTVTVPGSTQRLRVGSGAPPATTQPPAGGGPAAVTALGRRCEPGSVPLGPLPVRGWAADCAARCGLPGRHSGLQGAGSPDCIAIRWAARRAPGRRRWGQRRGRDRPGETAEDAVHCEGSVYPPGPESRAANRNRRRTPLG
jgi:hypothetical protein